MAEFDDSMSKLYNEGFGNIDESEELVKREEDVRDISTKKREEQAEAQKSEKSLEELLGASDPELAQDESGMSDDESGSGMFRLSTMIANSSVQTARTPSLSPGSIVPPPASASVVPPPPASGSVVPPPPAAPGSVIPPPPPTSVTPPLPTSDIYSAQPALAVPVTQSYGTVEPFEIATTDMPRMTPLTIRRKSVAPIFAVIAAMIIAAVIGIFVFGETRTGEDARLKQLAAQMDSMTKAAREKDSLEESLLRAEIAKIKAGIVNTSADKIEEKDLLKDEKDVLEKNDDGVEGEKEAEADEAQAKQDEVEPAPKRKKRRRWRKRSRRRRGRKTKSKVISTGAKSSASAASPGKQTGQEELSDLLGSGKSAPSKKEKASSSGGGGKPTRAEVKAAMRPVSRQAKSCSKFAQGTVQLRVTVGGNGRVKQSKAMGSFSGTNAGKCVATIAKGAQFSPFSGPSFSFTYPVRLQ